MLLQPRQTLVFTGDSITDCGRRDTNDDGLGRGYVRFCAAVLLGCHPELDLRIINTGISGNTVVDLEQRWDDDVLAHQPDWLSILIGVNDAARFVRSGMQDESLAPDIYEQRYGNLLERVKDQTNATLVLWEPFIVESIEGLPDIRKTLERYIAAVYRLADRFETRIIQTDRMFEKACKLQDRNYWAPDGVHPSPAGHGAMAWEFLKLVQAV